MKHKILIFGALVLVIALSLVLGAMDPGLKYQQYSLAVRLYRHGDYRNAVREFRRLLTYREIYQDPFLWRSAEFLTGMALLNVKRYEQALAHFHKLKEHRRGTAMGVAAHFYYAKTLHLLDRLDNALYYYDSFLKTWPRHELADNCLFQIGMIHFLARQYKRAAFKFRRILREYPGGSEATAARTMLDTIAAGLKSDDGGSTIDKDALARLRRKLDALRRKEAEVKGLEQRLRSLELLLKAKEKNLDALRRATDAKAKALQKKEEELKKFEGN